jgi:hypothetical protein
MASTPQEWARCCRVRRVDPAFERVHLVCEFLARKNVR